MRPLETIVLEGDVVRLEPIGPEHVAGLFAAGRDPDIWRWMPLAYESEAQVAASVELAREKAALGEGLSFATRAIAADEIVGSSSYLNVDVTNGRLEIGFTWITPAWQRTAVNTEAKLLMLRHAFDSLGCERVEFKTDALNQSSRDAIARLGAVEEGTLRHHMVRRDGSFRDSVYFSVLREEWPRVQARLVSRLAAGGSARGR